MGIPRLCVRVCVSVCECARVCGSVCECVITYVGLSPIPHYTLDLYNIRKTTRSISIGKQSM